MATRYRCKIVPCKDFHSMRLSLIQGLVRTSTQCRLFDDQPRHIWRTAQLGEVSKGASCLLDWEAKKGRIWKQISDARRDLRTDDGYPSVWMFCVPALSGLVLHQLASLSRMPSEQDELLWTSFQRRMNWWEPLFKAGSTDAHSTESSALLNVQPSSSVLLGKT